MKTKSTFILWIFLIILFIQCSGVNLNPINNNNYSNINNSVNNNTENNTNNTNNTTEEDTDDYEFSYIKEYYSIVPSFYINQNNEVTYIKLENIKKLEKAFQDYYKKEEIFEIIFFDGIKYKDDNIIKVEKTSDFFMYFPYDIVNKSKDDDFNIIWSNKYADEKISVQFITIDRDIIEDADNNYINSLFFGFLSNPEFKEKLGINKWKPFIDNHLINLFNEKGIKVSIVRSGMKHSPIDKDNFFEYFIYTFYYPDKRKLVFLVNVFKFHKLSYSRMKSDGVLKNYYYNWISFISTFNFIN